MARWVSGLMGVVVTLGLLGCGSVRQGVLALDVWSFSRLGKVFLSRPSKLTLKEVYLSSEGAGVAGSIVVEGIIGQVGENGTYLVIEDDTGRILVVLTDLTKLPEGLETRKGSSLKVLGEVERSAKGSPQVRARAIALIEAPAAAGYKASL